MATCQGVTGLVTGRSVTVGGALLQVGKLAFCAEHLFTCIWAATCIWIALTRVIGSATEHNCEQVTTRHQFKSDCVCALYLLR